MYAQFFGLKQPPFSIAPDPRYLYMSERHREALAHLLYGVKGGGGFVLLTGEIGAGKTTVCRCFLEQIPKRCNVAYIFNPKLTVEELLRSVCDEFRIPYQHSGPGTPTVKDYVDALNAFLLQTHSVGQNNVLIIDEAQNLSPDVLEQLRLLTNLETNERKLLQIVLIGQPELRTMLARPELEQLAQRVIARFHLQALSASETAQYVRHRLAVAGMKRSIPFDKAALQRIHALSRGVPRRINLLCDRALLGAYSLGRGKADREIVEKAAQEVFDTGAGSPPRRRRIAWALAFAAASLLAIAAVLALTGVFERPHANATVALGGRKAASAAAPAPAASAAAMAPGAASAVAAAASAPPPAAVRFDPKTGFAQLPRSEQDGWRALAALWKLEAAGNDVCAAARRQQLQCFRGSGNLALLRQLDRPALLTLRDSAQRPAYALLSGLAGGDATLRIADTEQRIATATLDEVWRGEFATLWRAPPGYAETIVDGSAGPAAEWVGEQLAQLPGAAASAAGLRPRVQAFQSAHGLKADGLAGPVTLMQLNRAVGIDEPRLLTQR